MPRTWFEILGLVFAFSWLSWTRFGQAILLMDPPWLRGEVPAWG